MEKIKTLEITKKELLNFSEFVERKKLRLKVDRVYHGSIYLDDKPHCCFSWGGIQENDEVIEQVLDILNMFIIDDVYLVLANHSKQEEETEVLNTDEDNVKIPIFVSFVVMELGNTLYDNIVLDIPKEVIENKETLEFIEEHFGYEGLETVVLNWREL